MADGYASRFNQVAYQADTERRLEGVGWVQSANGQTRPGKRPGTGLEVTVGSSPDTAIIAPGRCLVEHPSGGPYRYWLGASVSKALATRPSSGTSRIDLVIVRIYDADVDNTTTKREPAIEVLAGAATSGTPTPPDTSSINGFLVLAQLAVPATGAISVSKPPQRTVTTGGIVPVSSQADRDTIQTYNGLKVYREDLAAFQSYRNGAWETDAAKPPVVQSLVVSGVNASTPTSGTATWVALGNIAIPAGYTKALVNWSVCDYAGTASACNASAFVAFGAVSGSETPRIPGSSAGTSSYHSLVAASVLDVTSIAGTTVAATIKATFNAGSGQFSGPIMVASVGVTFLP